MVDPMSWKAEKLNSGMVADYKPLSFVDGEGIRAALYVSGCPFKCVGCYNSAAQSFRYGEKFDEDLERRIINDLSLPYMSGLSLLGGEPFLATNILIPLVRKVREVYGSSKTIWAWSGYTIEQLLDSGASPDKKELLSMVDVLVDGQFEKENFVRNLKFRGSTNQRIIDVRATIDKKEVVTIE